MGYVVGDSGGVYHVIHTTSEGIWLHPKHGDVTSDFTVGNTYTVVACQEKSSGTLYTDTLPVTEHFLGTSIDSAAEITASLGTVPFDGIITAGVWQGATFADMRPDGTKTEFQLSRNASDGPSSVKVDGSAATYTWDSYTNSVTLDSAPAVGSYLTIVYNSPARTFRPYSNSGSIVTLSNNVFLCQGVNNNMSGGYTYINNLLSMSSRTSTSAGNVVLESFRLLNTNLLYASIDRTNPSYSTTKANTLNVRN